MRSRWAVPSILAVLFVVPAGAQSPPRRDPQAVALLQQSFAAMGGTVPKDSVLTGSVLVEAGGISETGTIRILTRGVDQTSEEVRMGEEVETLVFSGGLAKQTRANGSKNLALEEAVTSQSSALPLLLVASALSDSNVALEYIGEETISIHKAHHVRFWNTFSNPRLEHLAQFSARDLWVDMATGLPVKLSFERREAAGNAVSFLIEVYFSDFRNVGGVLFPFGVKKSLNGTPWTTVTITTIQTNTGLDQTAFLVR